MDMKEGNGRRDRRAESSGDCCRFLEAKPDRCRTSPNTAEFDDWVVDFTGYEFPDSRAGGNNPEPNAVASVPEPVENAAGSAAGVPKRRWIGPCLLSIFVAACLGAVWCAFFDSYTAETKLLFISPVATSPGQGSWNVEQEVELLKSSTLAHRVLDAGTGPVRNSVAVKQISSPAGARPDTVISGGPANADELLGRLSFDMARWHGGGSITIAVRGNDPQHLKSILNSYSRQYLQSRHELVSLASISAGPTRPGARFSGNQDFISVLDAELARMELMKRNCALALTLMDKKTDKKKGSTGDFLPSGLGSELTSLNKINDELVNLFIKKQHLATRFHPTGREIAEVNQQIDGLRKMLHRHLQQQVTFLQSGMDQLEARKREIQGRTRPASGESEFLERKLLCGNGPAAGEWIPISSDVVIMPGRPIVVKKPIRELFTSFIGRSVDSLLNRRNKPGPTDGPNGAPSRLACTETLLEDRLNGGQGPREIPPVMCSQDSSSKQVPSGGAHK